MDNSFEKNFEREQEIRRQYDAADSQGSEEGRAAARKAYQKFREALQHRAASMLPSTACIRRQGNGATSILTWIMRWMGKRPGNWQTLSESTG